jgi:hypothetical protein
MYHEALTDAAEKKSENKDSIIAAEGRFLLAVGVPFIKWLEEEAERGDEVAKALEVETMTFIVTSGFANLFTTYVGIISSSSEAMKESGEGLTRLVATVFGHKLSLGARLLTEVEGGTKGLPDGRSLQ